MSSIAGVSSLGPSVLQLPGRIPLRVQPHRGFGTLNCRASSLAPRAHWHRATGTPRSDILRVLPWVLLVFGRRVHAASAARCAKMRRIDSHLHLWTADTAKFPVEVDLPKDLYEDGRATHENFIKLMDDACVESAVVVQPVNYGQDYRYVTAAMDAHPGRLKGFFVADARQKPDEAAKWLEQTAKLHPGWVGVRFNPYKWPTDSEVGMADATGVAMFKKAAELRLVVGFMPFQGLSKHTKEIEALLQESPDTQVIIDHWGFFLQPATGAGDRKVDEESWEKLLSLSKYPQVHVKISALFRVSAEPWPFASLSPRLETLLATFGSKRLLWGSDFPYATAHSDYAAATRALEEWPAWKEMSDEDKANILGGTSEQLFGPFGQSSSEL
mmetsp:Transcript_10425/g.23622  ORF Transcript_10425/g.23622 Transcript_10425/m.23622 type:complete len:385 (-) Transcript_10425:206-1360(-)